MSAVALASEESLPQIFRIDPDLSKADSNAQRALEHGGIVVARPGLFTLTEDELQFLLSVRQSGSRFHKNIAFHPLAESLSGAGGDARTSTRLREIFKRYHECAADLVTRLAPEYARRWRVDYTSLRPIEERGRKNRPKARNDLLHIDAFPTRPSNGDRILRVFTNVNPAANRVWVTTNNFGALAQKYALEAGLMRVGQRSLFARSLALVQRISKRPRRSPYDRFMLHFHDWLKLNNAFQVSCPRKQLEFVPGETWLAFTDDVPHAVLSGQYAIEQTFMVPCGAMAEPELAPIHCLERICGLRLSIPV